MKGDNGMMDRDFETLYKSSSELEPSSDLESKILLRMEQEMEKKSEHEKSLPRRPLWKRLMPFAACLLLVLGLFGGFWTLGGENYQTVYIDVNPSVALHVNRFGHVSEAECLNADAKKALNGIDLVGLSAEDALEKMLEAYVAAGYLEKDAELHISAVAEKNKNVDKLLDKLAERAERVKGNKSYEVKTSKMSAEDREQAAEYGVSPGKYRVIAEVIEKHPEYTVEELKDLSMAELKGMLGKGNSKK